MSIMLAPYGAGGRRRALPAPPPSPSRRSRSATPMWARKVNRRPATPPSLPSWSARKRKAASKSGSFPARSSAISRDGRRRAHWLDPDGPPRLLLARPHREGCRGLQRAFRVPRSRARHEGDRRSDFAGDEGDQPASWSRRAASASSAISIAAPASSPRATRCIRRRTWQGKKFRAVPTPLWNSMIKGMGAVRPRSRFPRSCRR